MSFVNPAEVVEFADFDADGRRCQVLPLSAKEAREVAFKLMGLIGSSIRSATASGAHPVLMDATTFGYGLEIAAQQNMLEWFHGKFLPSTQVESAPGSDEFTPMKMQEDIFFAGQGMGRWLRWLAFCVEVNCSAFFVESRLLGPKLRATYMPKKASPSPSTSEASGSSTGS
jgi:hypothetical protein